MAEWEQRANGDDSQGIFDGVLEKARSS